MTPKEQKKLIADTYSKLYSIKIEHAHGFDNLVGGSNDWYEYLAQLEREEREHRRFMGRTARIRNRAFPLQLVVQHFAVRNLLSYRAGEFRKPRVEDIDHLKASIFRAWNLWARYRQQIRKVYSKAEAERYLVAVDYSRLVCGEDSDYRDGAA